MKYYIDLTSIKDKYNYHIIGLYFSNIEDYIINLERIKKSKEYKIVDCGTSLGWDEEDIIKSMNYLMGEIK